ncbi:thermonuclease family protein [Gymnodinialimonas sp. 2305UL16-5]|uniref:thermonuclease family protein n=1 Tax=Gymnodinialimonas mytili TaxID=3126503 RepID=UPI0030B4E881
MKFFALVVSGLALVSAMPVQAQSMELCDRGPRHSCVVDGDTIWLNGVNYRLEGYDTPEEYNNVCGGFREIDLARAASQRLVDLLNQSEWTIQSHGRADRYDRVLANIYIGGEDVGDILIREGLARSWPDGPEFWCQ